MTTKTPIRYSAVPSTLRVRIILVREYNVGTCTLCPSHRLEVNHSTVMLHDTTKPLDRPFSVHVIFSADIPVRLDEC